MPKPIEPITRDNDAFIFDEVMIDDAEFGGDC
jgi:hypothetical protein